MTGVTLDSLEKRRETMEETWKHFTVTGKVTDYLKFCEEREKQEVKPDGDKPNSDRDGYRYHANRGV